MSQLVVVSTIKRLVASLGKLEMCKLIWNFKVFAYSTNHYTPIIDLDHFSSLPRRNASHIDQGLTPKGSKLLPYLGPALNQISLRSTEYFHYWVANSNCTNHLTLEWTNTVDKFWLISRLKILKGNKSSFFCALVSRYNYNND